MIKTCFLRRKNSFERNPDHGRTMIKTRFLRRKTVLSVAGISMTRDDRLSVFSLSAFLAFTEHQPPA